MHAGAEADIGREMKREKRKKCSDKVICGITETRAERMNENRQRKRERNIERERERERKRNGEKKHCTI